MGTGARRDDEIAFEVDAPGFDPETAPTPLLLEAASAFFAALARTAELEDGKLVVTGLSVRDKCVQIVSRVDRPDLARVVTAKVLGYTSGRESSPRGLGDSIERFRTALRALGPGAISKVYVGRWGQDIDVPEEGKLDVSSIEETTIRARVLRVGGKTKPKIMLESPSESSPFTLDATEAVARDIAHHLFEDVDIEARVSRANDGKIKAGSVISFLSMDSTVDPVSAWQAWFRAATDGYWDDVHDVERELSRDD